MQKGFVPILFLIVLLLIAAFGGAAYYFGKPLIKKLSKSQVSISSSADISSQPSELNDFPVYPRAIFVESGTDQTCNQEQQIKGLAVCNNKYYRWVTTDNFDQVRDWYAEATQKSGWKCNGGAGQYTSARDASGFGNKCLKDGTDPYELSYDANSQSTRITLEILKDSVNSNQSNETANWKTYTNDKYKYQFKYPSTWEQALSECSGPDISNCVDNQEFGTSSDPKLVNLSVWIEKWDTSRSFDGLKDNTITHYLKTVSFNGAPMLITVSKGVFAQQNNGPTVYELYADFLSPDNVKHYTITLAFLRSFNPNESEFNGYLSEFDQILSTFKFLP